MARKNIFEIIAENNDLAREVERIDRLFRREKTISTCTYYSRFTIKEYAATYCFTKWKNRGRCINVEDFLNTIGYDDIAKQACDDLNAFLTFIEIVLNFYQMVAERLFDCDVGAEVNEKFGMLWDNMMDDLSHYNYTFVYDKEQERSIIVEDKAEVTAVAEIVEQPLAMQIIKYNHYSLKENIDEKKAILLRIGNDLEPKRKALSVINKSLEDDIFYILNNLNLRHNNRDKGNKKYKEFVSQMDESELLKWYDELYQMMLLAYLELNQHERKKEFSELKSKIEQGGTN